MDLNGFLERIGNVNAYHILLAIGAFFVIRKFWRYRSTKKINPAFDEGKRAYGLDVSLSDNPYEDASKDASLSPVEPQKETVVSEESLTPELITYPEIDVEELYSRLDSVTNSIDSFNKLISGALHVDDSNSSLEIEQIVQKYKVPGYFTNKLNQEALLIVETLRAAIQIKNQLTDISSERLLEISNELDELDPILKRGQELHEAFNTLDSEKLAKNVRKMLDERYSDHD